LLTGDRAEHARVSRFPCTPLIQSFLTGHSDYLTAIAAGPHAGTALTAAADGTISVWDLLSGTCHCSVDIEALLKAAGTGSGGSSSSSSASSSAAAAAGAGEQQEQQQGSAPARSARKRPLSEVAADAAGAAIDDTAAAAAAASNDDSTEAAAAAAAEDDDEGEGEGGNGASPPSRAVYPTALAVQPGSTGLVAVAVCGLQGVVAVLRISSSSSVAVGNSKCELAHTLQLGSATVPAGEVQAVAFAAGFLFVVAEGQQCMQVCIAVDYCNHSAQYGVL
jgi:hypothetical protein